MQSEDKTKKKRRFLTGLLKAALMLTLLGVIGWQLSGQRWHSLKAFRLESPLLLIVSILLVVANQGCEWFKWKLIARKLTSDIITIRHSFWAGIGTGFMSPNGWGNFVGRLFYFRKRDRFYILSATFTSNVSQVLPTLFSGAIACAYTQVLDQSLMVVTLAAAGLIFIAFFFIERVLPSGNVNPRIRLMHVMKSRIGPLRLPLFLWSLLRFLIFSLQYTFLFMAFGYDHFWWLLQHVWLIFLLTSFVPSLWSGKVLIRETAALYVFAGSSVAVPDVIVVSLLIWLINVVLPAFVSSFVWFPVIKKYPAHVVD